MTKLEPVSGELRRAWHGSGLVFAVFATMPKQVWIAFVLAVTGPVVAPWCVAVLANGSPFWITCGIVFGFVLLIVGASICSRAYAHNERLVVAGLCGCPACFYDLEDVPATEDGCTLCPECGAAWRLGDSHA